MFLQMLVRAVLAVIGVLLFRIAVPAFLGLIGFDAPGALLVLLNVTAIAVAIYYVVKGPPVF